MPFSFLLKAYVPDSRKCCMRLWRASGEEVRGEEESRRGSREKEERIGGGKGRIGGGQNGKSKRNKSDWVVVVAVGRNMLS